MAAISRRGLMRLAHLVRRLAAAVGCLALVALMWIAAGWSTGLDRWLDVTGPPTQADGIVVLGGGTGRGDLPLPQGWDRILTATRLHRDGFAPWVVFTGAGGAKASEAEIYANAAAWLGLPRAAMVLEVTSESTSDHGLALRGLVLPDGRSITSASSLLVVTSRHHSRRALMGFARAGFTRVRMITDYAAVRPAATGAPEALTSSVMAYTPSTKRYDDVLHRLAYGSLDFFLQVREVGAIAVSRAQGR